jgi:sporulation protein YabP
MYHSVLYAEDFSMLEQNAGNKHSIFSSGREGIKIDGVLDVVSFDERGVALGTCVGSMAVEGEELHVTTLDLTDGRVIVEGKINGTYYFDPIAQSKRGLFGGGKQKK